MNGLIRKALRLGAASGLGYGVYRTLRSRRGDDQPSWSPPGWEPGRTAAVLEAARAQARSSVTLARAKVSTLEAPAPAPIPPSPTAAAPAPTGTAPATPSTPATRPPKAPAPTRPVTSAPPPARADGATQIWVKAADGHCPESHPIKAKLASKIFHVPGGRNYERTKADRCYAQESAAEADGLRAPQR